MSPQLTDADIARHDAAAGRVLTDADMTRIDTSDRVIRDHLKDEGFLDSVWNVVKSPVSILYSLVSGEDAKSGSEDRKRADELQRSGTPEQRREFAKEIILKNIPGASTIYKATHGNVSGAAGDVTGGLVLGGLIKGTQKTAGAAGTIRDIVTDPAVIKATRAAIPAKYKHVIDAAQAVRNRISAGKRGGPVEQPQGGHFSNPPSEILPRTAEQPQGGHFPARSPMGPPPAPPEPGLPAAGAPTAAEFEAAATRPADVGRMAPAEARADFEQRRATRTQGQPPTPGQQFAESQGYDWAKLSPDDRLALEQIAEAQANMAAQNLEVPPRPAAPPAPAEPRTLADLIPETELERQLGESIRQAQAGKPTAAEVPPQPAAPVQKAENIFAKNARLAKAVRVADAAQEAGLKSGDIFRMSPAEFAEKVGEKSISADTMAMVVDKLRRLESQAPPAAPAPAPAPTGPKSTPPSAAPTTLRDLMQPEPPAAAAPRKLPSDARVTFKPDPEDAGTWNVKATIGNESIGSMDLIERPNDLEVDLSHLLPKYRGQGYGKVMYQEALKKAQELGKRRLISGSEFTEDAARVWRSLGGEEFTDAHGETRWRLAVPAEPKAAAPRPRRAKPTR